MRFLALVQCVLMLCLTVTVSFSKSYRLLRPEYVTRTHQKILPAPYASYRLRLNGPSMYLFGYNHNNDARLKRVNDDDEDQPLRFG
ncbi:unnamed protein product [Bursaphelenchus okinawaensis]|uniref:Uncharacterized protein n=1 Tax=Bursaphelenchus okinawaensis TaxID=465554 RepID=A0A811KPQ9_9BILA|nr:unnamed protein product [Bursaphelenchus okinawaensis]CAG9108159.1 unnamed protein product [Bursaphelenchus okinawaensis]